MALTYRLRNSWLRNPLSWFASNTLMILWECFHSAGSSSGDTWLTANIRCALSLHTSDSLPLQTQNPNESSHACRVRLFSSWIGGFLRLFWASRVRLALSRSVHGHISAGALGQTCCVCVGAVLVVLVTHLHFYVSVWGWLFLLLQSPLGFSYILCVVALLCLLENSSVRPFRKWTAHSCLSVALLRKHWCLFLHQYLCIYVRDSGGQW